MGQARPSPVRARVLLAAAAVTAHVACGAGVEADATGTLGEGLPCDVKQVLAGLCWTCHGAKPANAAPMSLTTYTELMAPAKSDPTKSYAEVAVARMQSATAPMPPGGGASAADVATLQAWLDSGAPKGSCNGGEGGGGPFGGPVVCTSGRTWTYGEDVSDAMRLQMHPGGACNACHASVVGDSPPIFRVAGTVYPTGHEPDECYGVDGTLAPDLHVHVEDSQGHAYDLPVNGTGNFLLDNGPFVAPYAAKVVSSKGVRAMAAKQTSGDCNACHTQDGAGASSAAPGRIVAP